MPRSRAGGQTATKTTRPGKPTNNYGKSWKIIIYNRYKSTINYEWSCLMAMLNYQGGSRDLISKMLWVLPWQIHQEVWNPATPLPVHFFPTNQCVIHIHHCLLRSDVWACPVTAKFIDLNKTSPELRLYKSSSPSSTDWRDLPTNINKWKVHCVDFPFESNCWDWSNLHDDSWGTVDLVNIGGFYVL